MSNFLWPYGLYSPWNSPGQNTGVGSCSLLQWVEPRSPTLQVDSLPAEPPGKPKNIGVDSLSILQWIFLTQELNQGLLHCRHILYWLSYQGSPKVYKLASKWILSFLKKNAKVENQSEMEKIFIVYHKKIPFNLFPYSEDWLNFRWNSITKCILSTMQTRHISLNHKVFPHWSVLASTLDFWL